MHIAQASVRDLDAVAPLFDAYRQFYGQTPDIAAARDFLGQRMAGSESIIFLARTKPEGPAAGFTQLYPSFSSASLARVWILNDLFVAKEARRQGVARALLDRAVDFAREYGAIRLTLCTAIDNADAQALYEGAGWVRNESFTYFNFATA